MHLDRAAAAVYDVTGYGIADGENGLESDIIRVKTRIDQVIGTMPKYIRAVGPKLSFDNVVKDAYGGGSPKHIGVNVDSKDNAPPRPSVDELK